MNWNNFYTSLNVDRILTISAIVITIFQPVLFPILQRWYARRSADKARRRITLLSIRLHVAKEHPTPTRELVVDGFCWMFGLFGAFLLPQALVAVFQMLHMKFVYGEVVTVVVYAAAAFLAFRQANGWMDESTFGIEYNEAEIEKLQKRFNLKLVDEYVHDDGCKIVGTRVIRVTDAPVK